MAQSGLRARVAGIVAGAGAVSLLLGAAALVVAPAASADQSVVAAGPKADPPGNNGTIKIEGVDIQSGPPDNNPHQGCTFVVEFYNYDKGDLHATVTFEDQAPTADAGLKVVSGEKNVFIGEDAATGGNDLDAKETYTLSFTGQPHPQQGYHVKITVHADGSIGNDTKHKVFWVEGCAPTPPTTKPPTTKPPTTPPTTAPTTKPPTTAPTTPPTTVPTTKPPTTAPTTTVTSGTPTSTDTPVPSDSVSPSGSVPTAVNAGIDGGSSGGGPSHSPFSALGGGLVAAGGVLLAIGAAIALRRRGRHSI
jgi:hypothetical protein